MEEQKRVCDWCFIPNRDTYDIRLEGGSQLHICGICFMSIQKQLFWEDKEV